MGLFTGRKSSVEDVEGVRVPPALESPPMADNCCASGCQCAQHHSICEPIKTTQIGPNGQVITTEAYHTSYACYDPNCTGDGPCSHTIQQVGGGAEQVMFQQQQPKFQRVVTTTTTTTTSQPAVHMGPGIAHQMMGQQQQMGQMLAGQMMAQGQPGMMAQGQAGMMAGMAPGQTGMRMIPMIGGTAPMQMLGGSPFQMVGGQAIPMQMVGATGAMPIQGMMYSTGTTPVLVNQSNRPMPTMINGIPVVIPKK